MRVFQILEHDDMYRADFEAMHAGRNLNRHGLRGTYFSGTIAALWNQHVKTIRFLIERGLL